MPDRVDVSRSKLKGFRTERIRVRKAAIVLACVIPWLLGAHAVFIESAQHTGLGLFESYAAFQAGSNLGHVIWFTLWSGMSATTCSVLMRRTGLSASALRMAVFVLIAYAVPAVLLIFPEAAMGFAVSHVRTFTDETVPYSRLALFLIQSGSAALVLAATLSVARYASAQKHGKEAP